MELVSLRALTAAPGLTFEEPGRQRLEPHIEHSSIPSISIGASTLHYLLRLALRDESMCRPTRQRTMGFA